MLLELHVTDTAKTSVLSYALDFLFEKERYSSSTHLTGKWICETEISNVISLKLYIDGKLMHFGYPSKGTGYVKEEGRGVFKVNSYGYTKLLEENRPASGIVTNVDLNAILNSNYYIPNVSCQQSTPTVNYVNYYEGTSKWKAMICYSIRAYGIPPYIRNDNTVLCTYPDDLNVIALDPYSILLMGKGSDLSRVISHISETDVDGTLNAFSLDNPSAISRSVTRHCDIPFDYEWVMDSELGLSYRINSSMKGMDFDYFTVKGYLGGDLLDHLTYLKSDGTTYLSPITKISVAGHKDGFTTTYYCYHDAYH